MGEKREEFDMEMKNVVEKYLKQADCDGDETENGVGEVDGYGEMRWEEIKPQ